MYNLNDISFFLRCGFLPKYQKDVLSHFFLENDLLELKRNTQTETGNESLIIEKGIRALKSSFKNITGDIHIVPLSGGLDSRTILAELIDVGLKDKIITVSFGSPGAYDYEIGAMVANKLRLQHKKFDLTNVEVNHDLLIETAKNYGSWTFLIDAYYNSLICKEFGENATYWSGMMGGELAGSHLPYFESNSWTEAKRYFLKWNQFSQSINLSQPEYNLEENLPFSPLLDRSILRYDDQLDFAFRQQNYIKRVVMFNGYNYKAPFLSSEWVKFILSIPRQYRINKYIYKNILLKAYPKLFSLPTTNNFGGSLNISRNRIYYRYILNGIRKRIDNYHNLNTKYLDNIWRYFNIYQNVNYIDFNEAIRNRDDFKSLVHDNMRDLKNRNILDWLDIDLILRQHQKKKYNHGSALMLLTALEISLKVSDSNGIINNNFQFE